MNISFDEILQITPKIFAVFALFVLTKLSRFDFNLFLAFQNQIILLGDLFFLYAILAYTFLLFQSKSSRKNIALTRDRWHTIYPKTVLSIPISSILGFVLLSYGFWSENGFVSFIILSLLSYLFYKIINNLR